MFNPDDYLNFPPSSPPHSRSPSPASSPGLMPQTPIPTPDPRPPVDTSMEDVLETEAVLAIIAVLKGSECTNGDSRAFNGERIGGPKMDNQHDGTVCPSMLTLPSSSQRPASPEGAVCPIMPPLPASSHTPHSDLTKRLSDWNVFAFKTTNRDTFPWLFANRNTFAPHIFTTSPLRVTSPAPFPAPPHSPPSPSTSTSSDEPHTPSDNSYIHDAAEPDIVAPSPPLPETTDSSIATDDNNAGSGAVDRSSPAPKKGSRSRGSRPRAASRKQQPKTATQRKHHGGPSTEAPALQAVGGKRRRSDAAEEPQRGDASSSTPTRLSRRQRTSYVQFFLDDVEEEEGADDPKVEHKPSTSTGQPSSSRRQTGREKSAARSTAATSSSRQRRSKPAAAQAAVPGNGETATNQPRPKMPDHRQAYVKPRDDGLPHEPFDCPHPTCTYKLSFGDVDASRAHFNQNHIKEKSKAKPDKNGTMKVTDNVVHFFCDICNKQIENGNFTRHFDEEHFGVTFVCIAGDAKCTIEKTRLADVRLHMEKVHGMSRY